MNILLRYMRRRTRTHWVRSMLACCFAAQHIQDSQIRQPRHMGTFKYTCRQPDVLEGCATSQLENYTTFHRCCLLLIPRPLAATSLDVNCSCTSLMYISIVH